MPWHRGVRSKTQTRETIWTAQARVATGMAVLLLLLFCLTEASAIAQPALSLPATDSTQPAASSTTFTVTTISIPTYPYADYLTTATNTTYNITYPVLDWSRYPTNPTAVPRTYTLLVLENAYLRVTLLPELGGRVYQIIDKATGHNQLYQNPVIKPTRWGPPEQGWWLAVGGIEWCLPVDEHGYESAIPWSWSNLSSSAGVTVTVQDTTASNRLRATVDVFLPSDRGYVVISPRIENPTSAPVDFKFWVNAALAPGVANQPTAGLSFIFNSPEMSVHSTGDARLPGAYPTMPTAPDYRFSWPLYEGVDYSQLQNWDEWLGFFEYPQAVRGYTGVYDSQQSEGLMRVFPPEVATGAKAFAINVRELSRIPALVEPLGVEWVKLWDEYGGFPTTGLPQKVLYNVGCGAYVNDLNAWRSRIRVAAQAGLGRVQAYEICNEPNIKGSGWGGDTPDPVRFAQMVCIAHEEIKAIDPHALVISGGLAPVGRIPEPWPCGEGNNCNAMDEWVYLEAMLDAGAGACMDAFGYHPYGFASPPERDPDLVSNAFTFRGVETLRDILVARGWVGLPVWATEFNWIRKPAEDGYELNCDANADYQTTFRWQEVTAQAQADYLVRAFQYADTHWPWMQGMVVWNLDWHDYLTWIPCFHSRYYALRRYDGTTLGAITPAYAALAAMDKRPWPYGVPVLSVQPSGAGLISEASDPKVLTTSLQILNTGPGVLTWTVALSPTSTLVPVLSTSGGVQGERLWITVDTHGRAVGIYTATLVLDAIPAETLGRPRVVHVTLHVVTEFKRAYLPAVMRAYTPPTPPTTGTPHGPSKIGTHALAEGGTLEIVQQVRNAGGHVALVKGLSFGYLCDVKQISPETVTIGRWPSGTWEAIVPEGDPAAKARDYMNVHMQQWAPYRTCVDYWEVLNEPDPPTIAGHAWLGEFFEAAMPIAEANGYKLALFSYSMGVPEIYEWRAIAETGVFGRAKAGGHILSLHEYGGPLLRDRWGEPLPQYPGQPLDDPAIPLYPDRGALGGRYRHLYRDILIPRNEAIPLALTEINLNIWVAEDRAPLFLEDIAWYDDRLREDDYVLGSAIFTLGGGIAGWDNFDYYEFLPELAARIIALKDQ